MQLHPSVDPRMVCAPFAPSSFGVLFLQRHPSQSTISLLTKLTYQYSFSSCNFPALHLPNNFQNLFLSSADQDYILTNISKSNSNYIIYMYMSIAIACGVDICTSAQSAFNTITYQYSLSLYINNKFFKNQFPLSAGRF